MTNGPDDDERPVGGYATLLGLYAAAATGFGVALRRSGRELPERLDAGDLALLTLATHKASRLLAKDRVASAIRSPFTEYEGPAGQGEVDERPTGDGLRRAVGELVLCPFCLGVWIASALAAGLVVAPRPTRLIASILSALTGSDFLQIAYRRASQE